MKRIVTVAAALAVLLVAGPWAMGRMARDQVDARLDAWVALLPRVRVVEREWTGGWFRSEQRLVLQLEPGLGARQRPPQILLRNVVWHGPFPGFTGLGVARVDSHLEPGGQMRTQLVQIRTLVGFLGGTSTTLAAQARRIDRTGDAGTRGDTLAWDDASLSIDVSGDFSRFDVKGRLPRIEFTGKGDDALLLNDVRINGAGTRIAGDLYDSDLELSVDRLRVKTSRDQAFEVEDIRYAADTGHKGDFLDYELKMGTGAVKGEQLSAAGLELAEAHYDFSFRHLHMDTLQKLMAQVRASRAQAIEAGAVKAHAMGLLQHDPVFQIDRVGIRTAQGDALMRGTVRFVDVTAADLASGWPALVGRIVADIRIEVAQALVGKAPNGMTMQSAAIDGGYARLEAGRLFSHIEFRNGQMSINGKPWRMPVPGMSQPAPGQVGM